MRPVPLELEDRRLLSMFTVMKTTDDGSTGTLRWAITQANATSGANTIDFSPTVFNTPQTITLSGTQLELSNKSGIQTITGPATGVTVSGGGASRILQIDNGVTASISGLTITKGKLTGLGFSGDGGGLSNNGTATLTDCTLSANSGSLGGALFNIGTITLTNCTLSGNSGTSGAGLDNDRTATLTNCTLSGNSATNVGGGLANYGMATLTNCTLSSNSAGQNGGGVDNTYNSTSNLTNCTVSGNSASQTGGGLDNEYQGTMNLTACTVSGNISSISGGGIYLFTSHQRYSSQTNLTDTIVAANTLKGGTASDLQGGGTLTGSYNLVGTGGAAGFTNGKDGNIVLTSLTGVGLGSLGLYGGPTETIPLLPGSPAIDAGTSGQSIPTTDQRGEPRQGPTDIGGFESQGFTLTPVTGSTPQATHLGSAFPTSLAVTVAAKNPVEPVAGGTVTFSAPATGASASLSPTGVVVIDSNGQASVTATAQGSIGQYTVTAATSGASSSGSFALTNSLVPPVFSGLANHTVTYGTQSVILSGQLAAGSAVPAGDDVTVTLNGFAQQALIGTDGSFTATFNPAAFSVAGSPYTVSYVFQSQGSFLGTNATSQLAVSPAPLTIVADNQTMSFGGAVPGLTASYLGFVNGDSPASLTTAVQLATSATSDSPAGTYAITVGGASAPNYAISFLNGTLTVAPFVPPARPRARAAAAFVTTLYLELLGQGPTPSGLQFWMSRYLAGVPRIRILNGFVRMPERRFLVQQGLAPDTPLRVAFKDAVRAARQAARPSISLPAGLLALSKAGLTRPVKK
jgi:hypothetical protein